MWENKAAEALAGAREAFFRCGYEGARVDGIAAKGKVSKATLYAHFPSKEQLFLRVVDTECERLAAEIVRPLQGNANFHEQLEQIANRIIDLVLDDDYIRLLRTCIGAAETLPEAARQYMKAGPERAIAFIEANLKAAEERGRLSIDNTRLASERFIHMCISGVLIPRLLAVERSVDREQCAKDAVALFLKLYGVKGASSSCEAE